MKLSTRGRYGLRAMIELARVYGEGPLNLRIIAKRQEISQKYLHTLLTTLKQANLVTVVRGAKGGFELSREPENILVIDVCEAFEGKISIIDCLTNWKACDRTTYCEARQIWKALESDFVLDFSCRPDDLRKIHKMTCRT